MRMLIYCVDFYPAQTGYSHAFQNLLSAISATGLFEIDLATPVPLNRREEVSLRGVRVIRWPRIGGKRRVPGSVFLSQLLYARKIIALDRQNNYDAIFFETMEEIGLLAALPRNLYRKVLVRVHAASETELLFFGDTLKARFKKAIAVNVISHKLKYISATTAYYNDFIKKHLYGENVLAISRREFFVINNCIDITEHQTDLRPSDKLRLLSLGRMDDIGVVQKGFTDFLFALSLLPAGVFSRLDVTIIGSGEQRAYLIQLANSLGIGGIRFLEALDNAEVKALLSRTDVVVLPSRFEGQSMFAIEAISQGAAVIFSNVGGLQDFVDGNGYLVPPKQVTVLSNAIASVAQMPPSELLAMRQRSIEIARERYAFPTSAQHFLFAIRIIRALHKCSVHDFSLFSDAP